MGILDWITGKKREKEIRGEKKRKEKERKEEKGQALEESQEEVCALCGQPIKPGEGKVFGGQHWHKKCLRKARKMAKSMI